MQKHFFRTVAQLGGTLLLVFAFCLIPLPVAAIESGGIGAVPANPRQDNPRTQSIFVFESPGGLTLEDGIKIVNNSDQTKTIRVYAVDSQHSSDGAFACAQEADKQTSVGTWIKLAKNEVTLQSGAKEVVPFTLALPTGVEPGEHNGCIAVQESVAPKEGSTNGIVLSFRSALRVAVTVPGDIHANVSFLAVHSGFLRDKLQLSPVLKNEGNVSVDANLSVGLKNIFGLDVARAGGKFALLKAEESRFNFEIDGPFWGGWYQKIGFVDYVPLREKAADQGDRKSAQAASEWIYVAPKPLALAIETSLIVLVIGGIVYLYWRKRQHALLATRTSKYVIQPHDNLQTLAEETGIDWRKLAKLNHMKPPYSLETGQTIRLPRKRANSGKIKKRV